MSPTKSPPTPLHATARRALRALRALLVASSTLALAACDDVFGLDACDETEPRSRTVSAVGATRLVVSSDAGELRVLGRPGAREVRLTGTACAEREAELDDVRLYVERRGDAIYVDVEVPARDEDARLDLTIDVPDDLPIDVVHDHGDFEARRVGPLVLRHGAGDVYVDDVEGGADVIDEAGHLELRRVLGDVLLTDGSGDAVIEDVDGFVEVDEKRAGDLWVRTVTRSVLVREDGAGDITVDDVGGDLTVVRDASGRIRHGGVRGRVSLP